VRQRLIKAALYSAFFVLGFMAGCEQMPAFAQDKPKPEFKVRLSATEVEAINSLGEKLTANRNEGAALLQRLHTVEAEIAVAHPGHHFNEASGEIVPDPPKAEPTKK
jgi:hypothetical protein